MDSEKEGAVWVCKFSAGRDMRFVYWLEGGSPGPRSRPLKKELSGCGGEEEVW